MKLTNPYVKNEIEYNPLDKIEVKTLDLKDASLDFAVAIALGYKDVLTECKQGGKWIGFDIVDNPMRPFWRCVEGHREGRGKQPFKSCYFQPTQNPSDIMQLMYLQKINVSFNDYEVTATYGEHKVVEYDIFNAVCKCVVLKHLGESVKVPVALTKQITVEYTLE